MSTHRTYKQKLKLLGAIAVLSLLLCYQLAIRKTLEEYSRYKQSLKNDAHTGRAVISLNDLRSRQSQINHLHAQYVLDTLDADKNLLSIASNYCKQRNMQLKEYRPINIARTDSARLLTREVTIEGGFVNCLKFLFELETTKSAGHVSSAEFKTYTDTRDKKIKLNCIIYVQNLNTY